MMNRTITIHYHYIFTWHLSSYIMAQIFVWNKQNIFIRQFSYNIHCIGRGYTYIRPGLDFSSRIDIAYHSQIIVFILEGVHLFLGDHMGHRAISLHIRHQHLLFWAKETSTFPHKGNTAEYQYLAIQACCNFA